jgi:predicted Zn-dependent peptidase
LNGSGDAKEVEKRVQQILEEIEHSTSDYEKVKFGQVFLITFF